MDDEEISTMLWDQAKGPHLYRTLIPLSFYLLGNGHELMNALIYRR
jgi:hypothetical protein